MNISLSTFAYLASSSRPLSVRFIEFSCSSTEKYSSSSRSDSFLFVRYSPSSLLTDFSISGCFISFKNCGFFGVLRLTRRNFSVASLNNLLASFPFPCSSSIFALSHSFLPSAISRAENRVCCEARCLTAGFHFLNCSEIVLSTGPDIINGVLASSISTESTSSIIE